MKDCGNEHTNNKSNKPWIKERMNEGRKEKKRKGMNKQTDEGMIKQTCNMGDKNNDLLRATGNDEWMNDWRGT